MIQDARRDVEQTIWIDGRSDAVEEVAELGRELAEALLAGLQLDAPRDDPPVFGEQPLAPVCRVRGRQVERTREVVEDLSRHRLDQPKVDHSRDRHDSSEMAGRCATAVDSSQDCARAGLDGRRAQAAFRARKIDVPKVAIFRVPRLEASYL